LLRHTVASRNELEYTEPPLLAPNRWIGHE